jgi:N-formylglutamate amidohydrolase
VVDLNRDPNNQPLYNDGRIITSICPKTNFNGHNIYKESYQLDKKEILSRIESYFFPYHDFLNSLIVKFLKTHSRVIVWDGHSIKRFVPTINSNVFPDLIIGNNDHQSCEEELTKIAFNNLKKSNYQVQINHPFKGGYITRKHGNPKKGINSIQLEMSKDLYMSENETIYDQNKSNKIQKLLKSTFQELIDQL